MQVREHGHWRALGVIIRGKASRESVMKTTSFGPVP